MRQTNQPWHQSPGEQHLAVGARFYPSTAFFEPWSRNLAARPDSPERRHLESGECLVCQVRHEDSQARSPPRNNNLCGNQRVSRVLPHCRDVELASRRIDFYTDNTKVRSFAGAWHDICVFVGHVVTTLRIILLNDLEASGAALRAMCLPPFFYLDVGPLGTLYIGMPGALAPNAPSIGAIRTLHHGVAVSRQINK